MLHFVLEFALSHLASQFSGKAKHGSNYRRLQRFFRFVHLDGDIAARLIIQMLNMIRPRLLVVDRTNWKLGSRDVNILVLPIVTRRFLVPLMWTLPELFIGDLGSRDRKPVRPATGG